MGIYATITKSKEERHAIDDVTMIYWTETRTEPGVVYERSVSATEWTLVEHTDCFCCSCRDGTYGVREGSDPYCRNHGWAGSRPCETHEMEGTLTEDGVMPQSVQEARRNW